MFNCPFDGKYCSGDYMGQDGLCDADTLPVWKYQEEDCKKAKEEAQKGLTQ